MSNKPTLSRRAVAEAVGTGFLLLAIVGSGIAADRLTHDAALTLLINALVTGAALAAVITAVGPLSGAHLNPAVTLAVAIQRGLAWRDVPTYIAAQVAGALIGVVEANLMFDLPTFDISETGRTGMNLWTSPGPPPECDIGGEARNCRTSGDPTRTMSSWQRIGWSSGRIGPGSTLIPARAEPRNDQSS